GQPFRAEDDERHHEDDQELGDADAEHFDLVKDARAKGRGCQTSFSRHMVTKTAGPVSGDQWRPHDTQRVSPHTGHWSPVTPFPMTTGLVLDRCYLEHEPGRGHPERPERIAVLLSAGLDRPGLVHVAPRPATREEITLVHDQHHFENVARTRTLDHFAFDADTPVSAPSFDTACL